MAKVLLIDDDELSLKLIVIHLEEAGYEVLHCSDGAEGIRAILEQMPDLVVLDLNMSYIDGFEVLEAIKGDPITRMLPVIVLFSRSDLNILEHVIELGAADFLQKPIRIEQLIAVLYRVLGSRA